MGSNALHGEDDPAEASPPWRTLRINLGAVSPMTLDEHPLGIRRAIYDAVVGGRMAASSPGSAACLEACPAENLVPRVLNVCTPPGNAPAGAQVPSPETTVVIMHMGGGDFGCFSRGRDDRRAVDRKEPFLPGAPGTGSCRNVNLAAFPRDGLDPPPPPPDAPGAARPTWCCCWAGQCREVERRH